MGVDHNLVLRELRMLAGDGVPDSNEWSKALGSRSMLGGSDNYDKMGTGCLEALGSAGRLSKRMKALVPGARERIESEVNGSAPFCKREWCSTPYHEWSVDGISLAYASTGLPVYLNWLKAAVKIWALYSAPMTLQQQVGSRFVYMGPGGYPAGMRSGPISKYREYAANYTLCRLAGLGKMILAPISKSRVVDVLAARKPFRLFSEEETLRLASVISGESDQAEKWLVSSLKNIRTAAAWKVVRRPSSITTYFTETPVSVNTPNLIYSRVPVSEFVQDQPPIDTPWPYSKERIRQPGAAWTAEVAPTKVTLTPTPTESRISVEGGRVEFSYHRILDRGEKPLSTVEFFPGGPPGILFPGNIETEQGGPGAGSSTLSPPRRKSGCLGALWPF